MVIATTMWSILLRTFQLCVILMKQRRTLFPLNNFSLPLPFGLINFYSQTLFDIRFLGFVYLSCFLVSIYILVRGLTEDVSLKKSYLISLLVIFILGDTSYTIYFNSFYTEATSFLLSVSVLAFSVYFYRVTKPRTWLRRIVLVILAQAVVLLIGTTRQEYLLIIGVIIAGLGFLSTCHNVINDCQ